MLGGVSSLTFGGSLRHTLNRMQSDLVGARKEVATGRVADVGLALGAGARQSVSLNRDLERARTIADTNGLASSRLSATQSALGDLGKNGQDLFLTLSTARTSAIDPSIVEVAASNALAAMTSLLNTSLNGEFIFGGTNTGEAPINDYRAPGSPAKAAFATAFTGFFGFAKDDPQAADITPAQMNGFLDGVAAQFAGPDWKANWSNGTDEGIESRVGLNETMPTSVGANGQGVRDFAFAASVLAEVFDSGIGANARGAVIARTSEVLGRATSGIATLQAQVGLLEGRLTKASDRLTAQADLFDTRIQSLEGVDPYEASTRVSTLMTQIENAYALTARMQQLSLAQYLG